MAITYNSSNAFTTMFGDEVTHLAQQKASKLQGAVRTVRGVTGNTYRFPVLGKSGVVKNKTAHQDIEVMSAINTASPAGSATWVGGATDTMSHSNVEATIDSYSTGEYIDNLDSLKSNIDLRSAYAGSIASAMNRAYDQTIIDALDGTTATASSTTGDTFSKTKLLALHEALNDNDVPMDDRYLVVTPNAYNIVLADANIINSADGPLSNALATGVLPNVFGFNIIMKNGLSAGAGVADFKCYAFHKDAIGLAVGKDITTKIDYVPHKMATLIAAEFSAGGKMIDPSAVCKFEVA